MPPLLAVRAFNALGKPFGVNPFPRSFANPATAGTDDRQAAFDRIYTGDGWPSGESRSGAGSELARTSRYVTELRECLDELAAKTIFDAPCGDLNWILPAVRGRRYIGGDIAPSLVADLHRTHPQLDIRTFDICEDAFPEADVWHCRDCFFHLPFADIRRALTNYAESEVPFALLTTHRARALHRNLDAPLGGWRYLDLERAPFSLPRPLRYLRDYRLFRDFPRYVGLWSRQQIKSALRSMAPL